MSRRKHPEGCTCAICSERAAWREEEAKDREAYEAALAAAPRRIHPELKCEIIEFGAGVETWTMDHGLVDDRGRKLGGIVQIGARSGQHSVSIHATRDGVPYGALRRVEWCSSLERARKLAETKLRRQREGYRRKFPGDAEPSRYSRPIKIF